MDIEEGEGQNLVINILVELCDEVLETFHGNVCTENNRNKLFDEVEITKSVKEVLSYMVDKCCQSLIPNQEIGGNIEDRQIKCSWNISNDEDLNEDHGDMFHQSATSSQAEKETQNSESLHTFNISEVEENKVSIKCHSQMSDHVEMDMDCTESKQLESKPDTLPHGIVGVFAQEKWCVKDEVTFDKEDNFFENKYILHQDNEEEIFDVKETVKEAQLDEQVTVQHVMDEDTEFEDETIVPNQEECTIQPIQESEPDKMDQTNTIFEKQVNMQHQIYLNEEQELLRDTSTVEKRNVQDYDNGDQADLEGHIAVEIPILQEQQQSSLNKIIEDNLSLDYNIEEEKARQYQSVKDHYQISQQCVEKDETFQETVQDHTPEPSVEQGHLSEIEDPGHLSQQSEVEDQKFEPSIEQDQISLQNVVQDHLSKQYVSQDQPFQETVQDQASEQSVEHKEIVQDKTSKQSVEQDQTSQEILESDQTSEESLEQDKTHQEIILLDQTSKQYVEQDQTSQEILESDQTSEESIEQNKTLMLQEATEESDECEETYPENEVQTVEHVLSSQQNVVQYQRSSQETMEDQTSEQHVEQDQTHQEILLPDQISEQSVDQDQTFMLNETRDQTSEESVDQKETFQKIGAQDQTNCGQSVEHVQASQQNVVQEQMGIQYVANNQPSLITLQDQTCEQSVEQDQAHQEILLFNQTTEQSVDQDQASVQNEAQVQTTVESVEQDPTSPQKAVQDQVSEHFVEQDKDKTYHGSVQDQTSEQCTEQNKISIVPSQTSEQSVKQDQTSQKTAVPDVTSRMNETPDQTYGQSDVQDKTLQDIVVKDQIFEEHGDGQYHNYEKNQDPIHKHSVKEIQTFDENTVQNQISSENVWQTSKVQDQIFENSIAQNQTAQQPDVQEQTFEQIVLLEQTSEKTAMTLKHVHNSEEQVCLQDQITIKQSDLQVNRTLDGECGNYNVLTANRTDRTELFTLRGNSEDKIVELSPISTTNQRLNSQCQQVQYCSEETPPCRLKRNFVAAEENKLNKEEPDVKRICIDLQCPSTMDDQAVPSVEAADHFVSQEEACIYSCCGASKPLTENTFAPNEMCTEDSVPEHVHTEKQTIQNEYDLPDQEMPLREGSAFKWKYVPSFETDAIPPKTDEHDGCQQLIRVAPLPLCRKPRRLGLSKKQKIQHLHPTFQPH